MRISVTDAKAQLTDLVRRAEGGEEIVLTRHDKPVVEIRAVKTVLSPEELREKRRKAFANLDEALRKNPPLPGPDAACSADFLYDEFGLPK